MDADLEPAVLSENLDKSIPDKAEPQESMKPSESIDEDTPVTTVKPKPSKKKKSKPHALNNASPSSQSSISKSQPSVAKFSNDAPKKKKSHPKTKLFSGTLRSAAAAHRNRQIHIPPIGSPGLLMLPNPALVANFPSDDGSKRKITIDDVAHLLHNGCLLPRTVFEQSMIAGGYTRNKRKNTPHRGSSTERTVDDMFDSDVNLYLHFPELISLDVWERRLKNTKFEVKAEEREDNKASDKQVEITTVEENGSTKSTANKEVTPPDQAVAASVDEDKGPMLVDMVIQSLTKYTGNSFTSDAAGSSKLDPTSLDPAVSVEPSPSGGVASNHIPKVKSSLSKRKRSCLSFFDMIPISLTATYPPDYVDKRRAYIHAVKEREDMIVESQEAFDDNVDNHEKYSAHKEAWDRMFEYQKQQIAKREAAAAEVEQKTKKEAEIPGVKNRQRSESDESDKKDRKNPINKSQKEEQKDEGRKEDPMDYMPQPPQLPPPERFVDVPEIPTPPSPPSVVELEQISGDVTTTDEKTEGRINKMYVSKVDPKLIQHLDPACFLPTSEGRYFGLLSNSIADPQFVGHAASGIRGVTSGGGTGLATSYIGGGRGAAGLVSGPLRGGMHSWQSRESSVSNGTTSPLADSSKQANKKEKREPIINTKQATNKKKSPEKPLPSSSSKTKRQVSETEGSDAEGGKKKIARVIPLATGDRNTLATEIASGPAGDEFPDGWTVKTYRRAGGETVGKTDRFWFSRELSYYCIVCFFPNRIHFLLYFTLLCALSGFEYSFSCQETRDVFHRDHGRARSEW